VVTRVPPASHDFGGFAPAQVIPHLK